MFEGNSTTEKTQRSLYYKWVKPQFPDGITELELRKAIVGWQTRGLSPNTIRSLVTVTRKVHQLTTGYPLQTFSRIVLPAPKESTVKALTKNQAKDLLSVIQSDYSLNIFKACMIAYNTGMRKSEIFNLSWLDIDFFQKIVIIRQGKNQKNRMVRMSVNLYDFLLGYSAGKTQEPFKIVRPFNPGPTLKEACSKAGVPVITFHGFRHTFATLALDSGKSIKEVQELLGHSKASTTIDIYWNHIKNETEINFT